MISVQHTHRDSKHMLGQVCMLLSQQFSIMLMSIFADGRQWWALWKAMVGLGAGSNLLNRYQVLSWEDLSINTSVIAPQVQGQQNKSLPWFLTMDVQQDADVREWMEDCKFSFC